MSEKPNGHEPHQEPVQEAGNLAEVAQERIQLSAEQEQDLLEVATKFRQLIDFTRNPHALEFYTEYGNFAERIRAIYKEDTVKCVLWHVAAGSTINQSKALNRFDFEGEYSIKDYIDKAYQRYGLS